MAIKPVSKPLVSLTIDEPQVHLTITIGNFHVGGSFVQFEDQTAPVAKGNISQLLLGEKAVLAGRKLKIITSVITANSVTNNIAVTIAFQGTATEPGVIHDTVDNTGDYYILTTEYQFQ
ncbi:hypothetical protein [Dinghuibacter silviterrae]|uniref:Uncharacterized protein n=1 Tax=Dinghuibacter silviterrae TaxID=1539049 RepID=A0A4R8DG89_9BACT|nr:hypothetical protein [Dinghuibacter silviterrae]TDW96649.1 hypothetical protein EDB95_4483 [Dinghuibacter silviterrae]